MSKKLDEVIDTFVQEKYQKTFKSNVGTDDKEQILSMAREKTKSEVLSEIKAELIPELKEELKSTLEEEERQKKISDMKKLLAEGFILALSVGLLVNQVTELIGFFKNISDDHPWISTIILSVIFLLICLLIVGSGFIKEFTKMYNNYMRGKSDNEKD